MRLHGYCYFLVFISTVIYLRTVGECKIVGIYTCGGCRKNIDERNKLFLVKFYYNKNVHWLGHTNDFLLHASYYMHCEVDK